jgi:outer membrane protein TolC
MATAFIEFDRARERNELGQVSDVDLLRLEASYHAARSTRYASQLQQRATRSGLANALNRPGQLPTDLVTPELPYSSRERGEVEGLTRGALAANARLKALRARVESARKTMRAVRAQRYPVVSSEVDVARYSPHFGTSREPARGGITLEVPLSTGGRIDAVLAEHRAELQGITARLAGRELEVRQLVLGLWLELEGLQVRGDELAVLRDSRELNLDRNRALYELEVAADLGDAMVEISDLRLREAELEFRTAIVWAQLDALRGQRVLREVRDR